MGDFARRPYCDYGASNCYNYLHFGIAEKIVHKDYGKDINLISHNDIALLYLNRRIPFDNVLKPVCLPLDNVPVRSDILTVAGWGKTARQNELPKKRAADIPLVTDTDYCEFPHNSRMCAGVPSGNSSITKMSCEGDSGGPLMQEWQRRRMAIEGIVSFLAGGHCVNPYYVTQYTRVRYYLDWIRDHISDDADILTEISIPDQKFPTDCGYTPMYPKENNVKPDEYSWLAYLQYNHEHINYTTSCLGLVINSRYVLTTTRCANNGPSSPEL